MSILTDKTRVFVEAVQRFEEALPAIQGLRKAIEAAHKDIAELLSGNTAPVLQEAPAAQEEAPAAQE
jgi:hypothetical protein